jgi:long-subunit fatty acid transport protein
VLIQNANSAPFFLSAGLAYQVTDWFRVGATFQNLFLFSETTTTASAYQGIFGQPEDHDLDIRMRINAVDLFTPMANLGLWVQPAAGLELGITGQLGGRIEDQDAKLTVRLPTNPFFDNARLEGDTVAASLSLPPMVRAGLRWVHSRGDVELNVTWEGWSVHDRLRVDPGVLVLTGIFGLDEFEVGSLDIAMEWQDTWAVSLGSDFVVLPERLTVRAGVLWEQGAIPDRRFSVFQWDADKIAPSIGVSVHVPEARLTIDAAYSHFFFTDMHISNSLVEQINPTFEQGAVIVGNGSYAAAVDVFGIGIEAAF